MQNTRKGIDEVFDLEGGNMKLEMKNRWHVVKQRTMGLAATVTALALSLTLMMGSLGCAQSSDSAASRTASGVTSAQSTEQSNTTASTIAVSGTIDESVYDLAYSDRDSDASYDEASAVKVELTETSASADSPNVTVDGSTVTITAEGVYVLSGTLSDGQIVVNAPEDAKVQIVLHNASIANSSGPAVYIQQADKCFITLDDGTSNSIADGSSYADADAEANAALYSECDLTLQGSGSLEVTGNFGDAVKTKDDLVVTGGTFKITAVSDALVGHDSVKVSGGSFAIEAGNDGIKSSKDDDESKGFIVFDGGSFTVKAEDKGVNAQTYLRVGENVTLDVDSGDDALHSSAYGRINGGDVTISAGDDAVHAEYVLEVNGGSVNVKKCGEGIEGQVITINDGTIDVVSNDDGINASTASSSSSSESGNAGTGEASSANGAMSGQAPNASGRMGGGQGGMTESDANCVLTINGGTIHVETEGDGVDSNGYLYINGGETYVSGPTMSGNGSLDSAIESQISGGIFVAAGSAGMAETFSGGSQAFALVNASGSAGDSIQVTDAGGNALASFSPTKSFQCVIVSAPGMADGESYNLSVNGSATTFQATTTGGMGSMGGGMGSMGAPSAQSQGGGQGSKGMR